MALIIKKESNQYPLLVRIIFYAQKWKYGSVLAPAWIWGFSPKLLYAMQIFYRLLDRKNNPISESLRALISNRVSQQNNCNFCFDLSASKLMNTELGKNQIHNLSNYKTSDFFSEKEKLALGLADIITLENRSLTEIEMQNLYQNFSSEEIVELAAWICFQNLSSKFNTVLDIPQNGFCDLIKKN